MNSKPTNVLLIEDNPGDAGLIREMLIDEQDHTFELKHVDRLSAGLERLDEGDIDLVLLDLSLSESRGLDTFLRVEAQAPQLPIVILTGLDDEALAVKAVQKGAQDYLVKGKINGNLLVRSMRYAIERKRTETALAWEAGVNAAVADLSRALISQQSIEDISNLVLEHAKRLTDSAFGYVGHIDSKTGDLVSSTLTRGIWDACQVADKRVVFEKFEGLWGWVLQNREPLLTNDPAHDPRSTGVPEGHIPIQRFLSAPALVADELVGQVALANPGREYTERDLALVERLAFLFALAVQRRRAEATLRRYAEEQATLYGIASTCSISLDPDELLSAVLDEVLPVLNADAGWVTLPGPTLDDPPHIFAWQGVPESFVEAEMAVPLRECPVCVPLLTTEKNQSEPQFISGCPRLPSGILTDTDLTSHIGVSLIADGRSLGVLSVAWEEPHTCSDSERALLLAISRQVGLALHKAQLYQEARQVDRLQVLNDLDRALASTLDLETRVEAAVERIATALDASMALVFLLPRSMSDDPMRSYDLDQRWQDVTVSEERLGSLRNALGKAEDADGFLSLSPDKLAILCPMDEGRNLEMSRLVVPLQGEEEEELVGGLVVGRSADRAFTDEDRALLRAAVSSTGRAIRNAALYRASQEKSARLSMINTISAAAVSSLQLDTVLQRILDLTCQSLGAVEGSILLRDEETDELIFTVSLAEEQRGLNGRRLAPNQGIAGWVAQKDEAVCVNNVQQDPRWYDGVDASIDFETKSLLCAPLKHRGEVTGVIEIVNKDEGRFTEEDLGLLEAVSSIAATAIENARLYETVRARVGELSLLNEIGLTLTSTLDTSAVIRAALLQIQHLFDADNVSLLQPDAETGRLRFVRALVDGDQVDVPIQLEPGEGVASWVLEHREPVLIRDAHNDPRFSARVDEYLGSETQTMMAVPLLAPDRAIGVIEVVGDSNEIYTEHELNTLQTLSSTLAVALENARLYEELKTLLREREEAQARLIHTEKMVALGRLVASIAHEINNPLQAMQSCLTLSLEELEEEARREELEEYIGIIEDEIDRISEIVRRLRGFYRPASSDMRETDILAALESVLALTNKQLQHSEVRVERDWPENLPTIEASPDQLKQVFLNLVLNAIDAMPEGGMLTVHAEMDQLDVDDKGSPVSAVRVECIDNGIGMPEDVVSNIFEPFYTTKDEGSGLGLSISYGIVRAHHGQITVESEPGSGTTFTILLPVEQP